MRRNEGNLRIVDDDSSKVAVTMPLRTRSGENGEKGGPLSETSQKDETRFAWLIEEIGALRLDWNLTENRNDG